MRRKNDLDLRVASVSGIALRKVTRITAAFIEAIRDELTKEGEVHIDGFGRFRVFAETYGVRQSTNLLNQKEGPTEVVSVPVKHRVHFSKAQPFKLQLQASWEREQAMEKYAVNEDVNQTELEKAAAHGCPECGEKVEKHGSVLICPTHGSAPFERSDGSSKD